MEDLADVCKPLVLDAIVARIGDAGRRGDVGQIAVLQHIVRRTVNVHGLDFHGDGLAGAGARRIEGSLGLNADLAASFRADDHDLRIRGCVVDGGAAVVLHARAFDDDLDRSDAAALDGRIGDVIVAVCVVALDGENVERARLAVDREAKRGRVKLKVLACAYRSIAGGAVCRRIFALEEVVGVGGDRSVIFGKVLLRRVGRSRAPVVELLDNGVKAYLLGDDEQRRVLGRRPLGRERIDGVWIKDVVEGVKVGDRHPQFVLADLGADIHNLIAQADGRVVRALHKRVTAAVGDDQAAAEQSGGGGRRVPVERILYVIHIVYEVGKAVEADLGDDELADRDALHRICRGAGERVVARRHRQSDGVGALVGRARIAVEREREHDLVVFGEQALVNRAVNVECRLSVADRQRTVCKRRGRVGVTCHILGMVLSVAVEVLPNRLSRSGVFRRVGDLNSEAEQAVDQIGIDHAFATEDGRAARAGISAQIGGHAGALDGRCSRQSVVGRRAANRSEHGNGVQCDRLAVGAYGAHIRLLGAVGGEVELDSDVLLLENALDLQFVRADQRRRQFKHRPLCGRGRAVVGLGDGLDLPLRDAVGQNRRVEVIVIGTDAEHDGAVGIVDAQAVAAAAAGTIAQIESDKVFADNGGSRAQRRRRGEFSAVRNPVVGEQRGVDVRRSVVDALAGNGVDIVQHRRNNRAVGIDVRLTVVIGHLSDVALFVLCGNGCVALVVGRDRDGGADPIGDPDVDAVVVAAHCAVELVVCHRLLERVDGVVVVGGI